MARDLRPLLLRLGIAVAISLAGYLRFRPRPRPPPSPPIKNELRLLTNVEALARIINSSTTPTSVELSPCSKSSGDDDGYLLPEFGQLVLTEFKQQPQSSDLHFEERSAMEEEIGYLRNLVDSLQERERTLEVQLLEYYGLIEQEKAVREMENQLKISTTEVSQLSLQVGALQGENERLQAQVAEYMKAAAELESVRENIEELQGKLRLDGERAEEKIAELQQKLALMQDKARRDDAEIEENLKRLKELENEVTELRIVKSRLTQENSELKLKLRSIQMPTSNEHKVPEDELLKESDLLREENDKLKKDIEQLYSDRCMDVEELVYLRWINACLRYELRNYQPLPGKTVARDLSRSLSPQSERKAKQLIVEYADFGIDERNANFLLDFDSDYGSSQASNEELFDSSIDVGSSTKSSSSRKSKFISKLKKLVLGKDNHNQKASSVSRSPKSCGNSMRRESVSPCSDTIERHSNASFSSRFSGEVAIADQSTEFESRSNGRWQNKGPRPPRSLDIHRLGIHSLEEAKVGIDERCKSDLGTSCGYQRFLSGEDSLSDLSPNSLLDHFDIDDPESLELRKLAEALRISRGSLKMKKRPASFSFS